MRTRVVAARLAVEITLGIPTTRRRLPPSSARKLFIEAYAATCVRRKVLVQWKAAQREKTKFACLRLNLLPDDP
jgi:hypothetical protein